MFLFVRWPSSSCNVILMLFLHWLLISIYFKNSLFPPQFWWVWTSVELWPQEFSPWSDQQHLCILSMPPNLACTGHIPSFPPYFQEKIPVQPIQLSASPVWLLTFGNVCSYTLRRWCLKSVQNRWTPEPGKIFSQETLVTNSLRSLNLLSSCSELRFFWHFFLLSTKILNWIALWFLCPRRMPVSILLMRSTLLTNIKLGRTSS